MEKVYVISENGELYNFLGNAPKYGEFLDNIEFINVTSVTNIVDKAVCVILDKSNYELDILRLFAKKMYVIICTEDGILDIDVEEDNRVLVVNKKYSIEQIYAALKMMLGYRKMEKVTEKTKEAEVDVKQAAQTDYLTGLPNRRGMYEYFSWGLKSDTVHCMFIDIDNFKKVNDTYGHKMGDKLLIRVSHMVKDKIGDAFFVRLSGDEFAVIIDGNIPNEQVIAMAESIIGSVDEVQLNVDVSSIISFSIGIMLQQSSKEDLDDILLRCDVAMYQAKKGGKGRYVVYNDIAKKIEFKMSVDRDKYSAFSSGQFTIYLQPRVNMSTMGIEGVDAGIYWEHPRDGLRYPQEFMEILEEDGFIVELENQMFDELCRIVSSWKDTPLENLTVNFRMSKKHMYKKDFVDFLNLHMRKYKLKPEKFNIGLTDIENHPKVQAMIGSLKKADYNISCMKGKTADKSTLLSASDTMADEWIIGRSLIRGLGNDRTSNILTKSIISLARELNINIVARDVEEKTEIDYLTRYGCDIATGKYFSKPFKPAEFVDYALPNITEKKHTYIYELDGKLTDQNGENEGKFIGNEAGFVYDEELKRQIVRFTGAECAIYENTLEIPRALLNSKTYSMSVFFKIEESKLWNAIVHVDFENGFCNIMPNAWDGVAMFRVKDAMYEEEWYDAIGKKLQLGIWHYITVTYNAKKQESRLYVDGELQGVSEKTHIIEGAYRIVIGGDPWQGNIKADVGRFVIRDYVLTADEIRSECKEYTERMEK